MSISRHSRNVMPVLCIAFPSNSKNDFTLRCLLSSTLIEDCALALRSFLWLRPWLLLPARSGDGGLVECNLAVTADSLRAPVDPHSPDA
jgi:hypothetical protein